MINKTNQSKTKIFCLVWILQKFRPLQNFSLCMSLLLPMKSADVWPLISVGMTWDFSHSRTANHYHLLFALQKLFQGKCLESSWIQFLQAKPQKTPFSEVKPCSLRPWCKLSWQDFCWACCVEDKEFEWFPALQHIAPQTSDSLCPRDCLHRNLAREAMMLKERVIQ